MLKAKLVQKTTKVYCSNGNMTQYDLQRVNYKVVSEFKKCLSTSVPDPQ